MTRKMQATDSAYRAVITTTTVREQDGLRITTRYEGPYATVGAARARITLAAREADENEPFYYTGAASVTGYVEKSTTTWERV